MIRDFLDALATYPTTAACVGVFLLVAYAINKIGKALLAWNA